jgi:hypothetical protein
LNRGSVEVSSMWKDLTTTVLTRVAFGMTDDSYNHELQGWSQN